METTAEEPLQEAPPILVVVTNASSGSATTASSLHQPGACKDYDGRDEEDTEATAAAAAIFLGQEPKSSPPLLSDRAVAHDSNRMIARAVMKTKKNATCSTELQEAAEASDAAPTSVSMVETPAIATNGRPREEADTASSANHQRQIWWLSGSRVKFCIREAPAMTDTDRRVRFLGRFRFGDTYKLKTRYWLMPQFLSGALTLTGVVLTLVGIISLQINKYLHACDAQDGLDCKSNKASINNVMMPIGVGSTGGGLSLILISLFVFVHAFCIIYDDPDNEDNEIHDGVLHLPSPAARAALLGSSAALSGLPNEAELARCQSYYDNLQDYVAPPR